MARIYPEIKTELLALQNAIEKLAEKSAVNPPADLKLKILQQIAVEKQIEVNSVNKETKIIPVNNAKSNKPFLKTVLAASILLLIGLGTYTLFLRTDVKSINNQLATTKNASAILQSNLDSITSENIDVTNQLAFLRNANTTKLQLNGVINHENDLATIFWNKESEQVLMDVENLAELTPNQSYQLWVIVDGVPRSMGVFNDELCAKNSPLAKMNKTNMADAFAITVEPLGGSEAPSLDQLLVIGTI